MTTRKGIAKWRRGNKASGSSLRDRDSELLFVSSGCKLRSILKLLEEQGEGANIVVIALDKQVERFLDANNIPYKTPLDYAKPSDLRKDTIKWLNEWSGKKIGGRNPRERLTYEGISLWAFLQDNLYFSFERTFAQINEAQHIIDFEQPGKVFVADAAVSAPYLSFASLEDAITAIAISKGIKVSRLASHLSPIFWAKRFIRHIGLNKLNKLIRGLWPIIRELVSRAIVSASLKFKRDEDGSPSILFLTAQRSWGKVYDPISRKYHGEDIYISPIIKELKRRKSGYKLIAIDTFYVEGKFGWQNPWLDILLGEFPNMIKKLSQRALRDETITWKSFYCYDNLKVRREVKRASQFLYDKWCEETKDEAFRKSLNYKGAPFWPLFQQRVTGWISSQGKEAIKCIEGAKVMIERENPAVIMIVSETGQYGRGSIIAGSMMGVPTIGLQHGKIHPRHFNYMHDDVTSNIRKNPTGVPIPTKTAVYGNYVRDVLTKNGNYPYESVIVCGQPRYDLLTKADEIYEKKEICEMLGLSLDEKIILLTTSYLTFEKEKLREFVASVIMATHQFDNVQLVIKPHPNESIRIHQEVIRKMGANKVKLIPGYLNELLYVCDLIINQESTTGLEAMILGKPVININYTGAPDQLPFVENGEVLGVYRKEELAPAIRSVFEDEEVGEKMKINRQHFVYEQVYKTDGKATERVVDLILEMCKLKLEEVA